MKFLTSIKINTKKKQDFLSIFKKLPLKVARRPLPIIIVLFLVSLLWGVSVFYKYVILPEKEEPEEQKRTLQIEESAYQEILSGLEEREENLKEADSKEYSDPFN